MVFCPNCDTILDISKTSSTEQEGGANYKVLFKKILAQTLSDEDIKIIKKINLSDINKNTDYKSFATKEKEFIYNSIKDILNVPVSKSKGKLREITEAFYICNNCGYIKKIKPNTKILSKRVAGISQNYNSRDVRSMVHNNILPFTRNYICPNKECESHKKHEKREAKFKRRLNSYKVMYICTACGTDFFYQ